MVKKEAGNQSIFECCFIMPLCFVDIYLLLTEFEGHKLEETGTDRLFSLSIYGPSAKCAGYKSKGKKRGSQLVNLQYGLKKRG